MTPILRHFEDHLPRRLVLPALALTYAAMICGALFFDGPSADPIIYIDLR